MASPVLVAVWQGREKSRRGCCRVEVQFRRSCGSSNNGLRQGRRGSEVQETGPKELLRGTSAHRGEAQAGAGRLLGHGPGMASAPTELPYPPSSIVRKSIGIFNSI